MLLSISLDSQSMFGLNKGMVSQITQGPKFYENLIYTEKYSTMVSVYLQKIV